MEYLGNKIFSHLENGSNLDQNLIILKRKLAELNGMKEDKESMKSVELQPRKKLKKEVEIWFRNVERINGEILNLENEVGGSDVLSRGFLGKKVIERLQEVEELIKQGKSYGGLVIDKPQWLGQVLSTTTVVGEVAKSLMEEIWAYLMDDGVSKIGVWGMGGVGKTTVMKLINNQLLKETENFDIVIWITVSKEMNIAKLQNGIARAINVSLFEDDDEIARAGMLYEMLHRKGKFALILDDLWHNLSLEEVGIPEPCNGSKLVITTRLLDVCHYLDCKIVKMPNLPNQDARSLFLQKVGRDVLSYPNILPFVESIVEQCAGLPLAIITVASSMKGTRNIHEWRNALNQMNRGAKGVNKLDEKVLQQLQFSYDRLEDETVKQCFLYCALFPEDCIIEKHDLIKSWMEEGFLEEMESMVAELDWGYSIMNKLISNCLLLEDFDLGSVQLHDLMRDMALRITSTRPRFLIKAGMQLKEIPDVQEWDDDLDKASLMENWELQIPSQMSPPKCQNLTTLLLSRCSIENIPECFFEQMLRLKILDLSYNKKIKSLPNSISNLETLTVLLLGWCEHLENVPSFSKLQALKKLDLRRTNIKYLPHGMERLVNLKYLDLCETSIASVADGILAKLTSLQLLAIKNFGINVRGEEIGGLRKLECFRGRFHDLNELNNYVQALHTQNKWPHEYYISVGGHLVVNDFYYSRKNYIELDGCNICTNGIIVLSDVEKMGVFNCIVDFCEDEAFFSWFIPMPQDIFSTLSGIEISNCRNMKKLFSFDWVLQNLHNLVKLRVSECEEMEEVIASESELEEEGKGAIKLTLPKLRRLQLWDLPELKSICGANRVLFCDSIPQISILHCPKLKTMPLCLPMGDDGEPYPPALTKIYMYRMK